MWHLVRSMLCIFVRASSNSDYKSTALVFFIITHFCVIDSAYVHILYHCNRSVYCNAIDSVRYLGIFIMRSTKFECSLDHAKSLSIDRLMAFLVKSAELPPRKWYYISLPPSAYLSSCMVLRSVH